MSAHKHLTLSTIPDTGKALCNSETFHGWLIYTIEEYLVLQRSHEEWDHHRWCPVCYDILLEEHPLKLLAEM